MPINKAVIAQSTCTCVQIHSRSAVFGLTVILSSCRTLQRTFNLDFAETCCNLLLTFGHGTCASSPSVTTESQIQHGRPGSSAKVSKWQRISLFWCSPQVLCPPSFHLDSKHTKRRIHKVASQTHPWQYQNLAAQMSQIQPRHPKFSKTKVLPSSADNLCTSQLPNVLTNFLKLLNYFNLKAYLPTNADMGSH